MLKAGLLALLALVDQLQPTSCLARVGMFYITASKHNTETSASAMCSKHTLKYTVLCLRVPQK